MDAGVALARRLRHHLHAGVEDFLAGHDQLGLAAAEQRREERAEMLVYRLERFAQQLACLAVDLADRVLERGDRLLEVGGLRVEVSLALAAAVELLERRQIDRAELADRIGESRNLALQGRGARRALRFGLQPRLVGVGFAKL